MISRKTNCVLSVVFVIWQIFDLYESNKKLVFYLARGKDLFAILPTGFGKRLSFQLFPQLLNSKAATKSEMCSIAVVSPLVSGMRDKLEQIKKLGSDWSWRRV